jgi:hypothetical protein
MKLCGPLSTSLLEEDRRNKWLIFMKFFPTVMYMIWGLLGVSWTFDNKKQGERNVKVRIDRAVAFIEWTNWFSDSCVRHLVTSRSDHLPILLDMEHDRGSRQKGLMSRYKIMWEREPSLPEEIRSSWEACHPVQNIGGCCWESKDGHVLLEAMDQGEVWGGDE